MVAMV